MPKYVQSLGWLLDVLTRALRLTGSPRLACGHSAQQCCGWVREVNPNSACRFFLAQRTKHDIDKAIESKLFVTAIPLSKEDQDVESFTFCFALALSTQSPLAQGHEWRAGLAEMKGIGGVVLTIVTTGRILQTCQMAQEVVDNEPLSFWPALKVLQTSCFVPTVQDLSTRIFSLSPILFYHMFFTKWDTCCSLIFSPLARCLV